MFVLCVGSITFNAFNHFNYVDIITGPNDKIRTETQASHNLKFRFMYKFVDQGQAAGRVSGVEAAETGQGQAGSVLGEQTGEKMLESRA